MDGNPTSRVGEDIIRVEELHRTYYLGEEGVAALRGISFSIKRGELVAIMGTSGSGKSTLMNILGCLDKPSQGSYFLDGVDVSRLSKDALAAIRNRKIGFVFQSFNLLSRTSALENVELPLLYSGIPAWQSRKRSEEALDLVGLKARKGHHPSQLSGGEQQRVAIARSLVNDPVLLLADEPTGNLDSKTSVEIMQILVSLNREQGRTIILVTHEHDIAEFADRTILIKDGSIIQDGVRR